MAKPNDLTGKLGASGTPGATPNKINLPVPNANPFAKPGKGGVNPAFKMNAGKGGGGAGKGMVSRRPKV